MIPVQFPHKEEEIKEETVYTAEEQEVITEGTVYKSQSGKNLSIMINISDSVAKSFIEDPYFKVFEGPDPSKAKRIARISIKNPHYIYHNKGGEIPFILNSQQRKELNELMSTYSNISEYKINNTTVYLALLDNILNITTSLYPKTTLEDIVKKFPQQSFLLIKE